MPFKSKAQVRYLYSQHPEIARRWAAEYGQKVKSLPARAKLKKRMKKAEAVNEFVFGQPGHPSPANTLAQPPVASPAAKAASTLPIPRNIKLMAAKLKSMARVAKRVKYRLKKMGFLKGNSNGSKRVSTTTAIR